MSKTKYDKKTKTLWVLSTDDGDTLIDELPYQDILKAGEYEGEPVKVINLVFQETGAAEYNQHALAFAGMGVFVGSLSAPRLYNEDEVTFEVKDDFGI